METMRSPRRGSPQPGWARALVATVATVAALVTLQPIDAWA